LVRGPPYPENAPERLNVIEWAVTPTEDLAPVPD
jgi:hypothetical protein